MSALEVMQLGCIEVPADINPIIYQALQLTGVSYDAKADVLHLLDEVSIASTTASKTSDTGLDDWSKPIYATIRDRMDHYGFVNGERKQPMDGEYWALVFDLFNSTARSSKYLKTAGSRHAPTAWEMNEAFRAELTDWVRCINSNPSKIKMVWPAKWA